MDQHTIPNLPRTTGVPFFTSTTPLHQDEQGHPSQTYIVFPTGTGSGTGTGSPLPPKKECDSNCNAVREVELDPDLALELDLELELDLKVQPPPQRWVTGYGTGS